MPTFSVKASSSASVRPTTYTGGSTSGTSAYMNPSPLPKPNHMPSDSGPDP